MNNHLVAKSETATQKAKRISSMLEKLRSRVRNFVVADQKGQTIGEVKDLIINPNHQLHFVIALAAANQGNRLILLGGNLVQKIEPEIRRVFTNMDALQIENFPEYKVRERTQPISEMSPFNQEELQGTIPLQDEHRAESSEFVEETEEEIIRLLGERVIVDRIRQKVGEVVVRKQIETRMVQVPVRREVLIVEQVGSDKLLAQIDLGEDTISNNGEGTLDASFDGALTVSGVFDSPKIASLLLNAIALEKNHGCNKIQVTISVNNEELQSKYLEWFERSSGNKSDPHK